MPAPKARTSKRAKRTADALTGASITEGARRTQVYDPRHIGYTQPGVDLTHLTDWARRCIRPDGGHRTAEGQIVS